MALSRGTRLGTYEVVALIGAGGMGEVYKARDTTLNREVALKVLPDAFARDAERMARFRREAQTLASLNHPHIAQIHGFEQTASLHALVMELVEGEDLSRRIARGALPLDEALPIARQIAVALEAAHERGIVHRDLKPANIKVRPDGTVKVLDFGLAKAIAPPEAGHDDRIADSPTITSSAMTMRGVILGTAAYMSPEQAKGKAVDKRADVWAFGCVLYEMLTGKRAFAGEDVSETMAFILSREPDTRALPASTPAAIRRLLRRCLEKDRGRRLPDIAGARLEIDDAYATHSAEATLAGQESGDRPAGGWRRAATVAAAAVAVIGASSLLTWAVMRAPAAPRPQPVRFAIVPPPANPLILEGTDRDIAISPDGSYIVYRAGGSVPQLMVRGINDIDARSLTSAVTPRSPFISPDSQWVGYWTGSELKKVSIGGGTPLSVSRVTGNPRGASWAADNTIVFATSDPGTGLMQVPAGGGEPKVLTTPAAGEGDHLFPSVLPGGRAVLFTIDSPAPENHEIAVLDFATGRRHTVVRGGTRADYVDTGHIVYSAAGTLRTVAFDDSRLQVLGDPTPVVEEVSTSRVGVANFAISRNGTLVYVPGATGSKRSLIWVDRNGREEQVNAPPREYLNPRISPDGTQVAVSITDQEDDIWVWDLARRTLRRLTFGPALESVPIWTPDGRRLIFNSNRDGAFNLYWQLADGTGDVERLTTSPNLQVANAISPDGTRVVAVQVSPKSAQDLVLLALDGERRIQPLLHTEFAELEADLSPDGRFLAYRSNESGESQVYVRPFPRIHDGRWQVSTRGGTRPSWAKSGRELFYVDANNAMTSVPVQFTGSRLNFGNPTRLFAGRYFIGQGRSYDVARDGQRFLMIQENSAADQTATPASLIVVLNWVEELKARWQAPQ